MKLLFLGTGAADGMSLTQDDDFLNKDHRRCSCALLDGHVMIDCGPHALNALTVAGVSLDSITDIIVTHRHIDHFNMENINKIAACGGVRLWLRTGGTVLEGCDADVVYMDLFTPYKVGDYELISVPANHDAVTFPHHLIISDGDKPLF